MGSVLNIETSPCCKFPWRFAIALVIAASLAAYVMIPPSVSSTVERNADGTLRLEVRKNFKVNGIMALSLCVDGDQKPIWEIAYSTSLPSVTVDLHDGGPADDGQMTQALGVGEQFTVRVVYQFDSAIPPAACADGRQFHYRIETDGRPKYLASSPW